MRVYYDEEDEEGGGVFIMITTKKRRRRTATSHRPALYVQSHVLCPLNVEADSVDGCIAMLSCLSYTEHRLRRVVMESHIS